MLTLKNIIGNIKKGQSALAVRAVLNELERSYEKMLPGIVISGCQKHGDNATTIYLTMPSSSTKSIVYDIVIWIRSTTKMDMDIPFKAYSNSPAFSYNFAYVFNQAGSLLFPNKYPKEFRELPPKTRNPYMSAGFDRHIFSGIRYISEYKIPKIIGIYNGKVPQVKSFKEKIKEVNNVRAELKRAQILT